MAVPRPPNAVAGGPAPWAHLPAESRTTLSLTSVRHALAGAGQEGPVPEPGDERLRPTAETEASFLPAGANAAVLVALFEELGEARVVLTRRATSLRAHPGEVSFPGGRLEPSESAEAAARREATDEVALDPSGLAVCGWLHPVVTFSSRTVIQPVVATLPGRPALVANPEEVARVFDVALSELATEGVFHEERWRVTAPRVQGSGDGSYPVWFFETAGEVIWGATARILYELLTVVLGVARPGGHGAANAAR